MNWKHSSATAFLAGAACMAGACALIMYGWFHFYFKQSHRLEVSALKNTITELEGYKTDYNALFHKYNILSYQNITLQNKARSEKASAEIEQEPDYSVGITLVPYKKIKKDHSIVINRLVYQP